MNRDPFGTDMYPIATLYGHKVVNKQYIVPLDDGVFWPQAEAKRLFETERAQSYIKRCQYCGRTNQKHGHISCDGCGAPR